MGIDWLNQSSNLTAQVIGYTLFTQLNAGTGLAPVITSFVINYRRSPLNGTDGRPRLQLRAAKEGRWNLAAYAEAETAECVDLARADRLYI